MCVFIFNIFIRVSKIESKNNNNKEYIGTLVGLKNIKTSSFPLVSFFIIFGERLCNRHLDDHPSKNI